MERGQGGDTQDQPETGVRGGCGGDGISVRQGEHVSVYFKKVHQVSKYTLKRETGSQKAVLESFIIHNGRRRRISRSFLGLLLTLETVADLEVRGRRTDAPLSVQFFFFFMQFSAKIMPKNRLAPQPPGWPPPGKS